MNKVLLAYLSPILYLTLGIIIMVIVGIFIKSGIEKDAMVAIVGIASTLVSAIVNKLRTVRVPDEEPTDVEKE